MINLFFTLIRLKDSLSRDSVLLSYDTFVYNEKNIRVEKFKFTTIKFALTLCCDFCHLLITFANSLDPDQDRQNVGPDLDPNRLTPSKCTCNLFFEKGNFKHEKIPSMQSVNDFFSFLNLQINYRWPEWIDIGNG